MSPGRIRQLAAEIVARAIDDILGEGSDNIPTDMSSARHVVGLDDEDMIRLDAALRKHRETLRNLAGQMAEMPNRDIGAKWGRS